MVEGSLPDRGGDPRGRALEPPAAEPLPRDPLRLPGGAGNTTRGEGVRRGVGFAVGFKNICFSEGFDDYCAARVRLLADGSAEVHCAAAELGQGVTNVILQVARTELGIDDVRLAPPSTATVESAGSTSASRQTYMVSGAVRDACRAALEEQRRAAAARSTSSAIFRHPPTTPLDPETGQVTGERAHVSLAVAAMKVVAEVDVELGLTRVVWIGAAQEVGHAIDPRSVEGQIEGGIAQGLGLAVMEEIQTRDGLITNASFTDYLIPTALDMPPVEIAADRGARPRRARTASRASASRRLSSRRPRSSPPCATPPGRELPRAPVRLDELVGLAG